MLAGSTDIALMFSAEILEQEIAKRKYTGARNTSNEMIRSGQVRSDQVVNEIPG